MTAMTHERPYGHWPEIGNPFPEEVAREVYRYEAVAAEHVRAARESVHGPSWERRRALPSSFRTQLKKAFQVLDQSHRYVLSHLRRTGSPVRCRPDCSHCCTQMPSGLTGAEILFLYDGLTVAGTVESAFRRCLERQEIWSQLSRWHPPGTARTREQELTRRLHQYHGLHIACPFLKGDLCSVYLHRPLPCRMHYSLSPPSWCRPSHFQHPHAVRFNLEPGPVVLEELDRLDAALGLQELSDLLICGFLEFVVNVMEFRPITWVE
ncbi:Putative zinc-or iron-chelating domain-containing protein [Desulfacinum hydrothermale DSM 13146]|uniref:Putative zinc-or iron-chelating domain-containing protein n=2 Tax=Desulfacinum hydrothermale TaxID=109258 RepID=A0A1W1XRG5_9BACT|nr:Putative zinc-or iron-chelating domain-containing protein [Desulfacinum hydrothermale DSM 13146]